MIRQIALIFVWLFCFADISQGSEVKLFPSDPSNYDNFGNAVCIDEDQAVIGAYGKDLSGPFSGAAYSFIRQGSTWTQQAILLASDGKDLDYFGWAVSLHGNFAIIGAPEYNETNTGAAYIFKKEGSEWHEFQKLLASDASPFDYFGYSVSISGNYAMIGAYGDDDNGSNSGSAYIFFFDGERWVQQAKLIASDAASEDFFGKAVSISGETVLIGAEGNDDKGSASGSAYIFKRIGGRWQEIQKIVPADGKSNDFFGASVSLYGANAVVGAPGRDTGSGVVYLYQQTGDIWNQLSVLKDETGQPANAFGKSVSISSTHLAVGAYGKNSYKGAAFVYRIDGSAGKQVTAGDAAFGDQFGYAVSVSSHFILCGAYGDNDKGDFSGSAYSFPVEDNANLPPTVSTIIDLKSQQNQIIGPIAFYIDDAETNPSELTVQFTSSNWNLVLPDKINLAGQDKERNFIIIPETNVYGVSQITMTVSDGQNFVNRQFRVTVNNLPQISSIPHQFLQVDGATGAIPFTVNDTETAPDNLILTVKSSNPILVPESRIILAGTGVERVISAAPASGMTGIAEITIFVYDGVDTVSSRFEIRVSTPNTPPTISAISDITLTEDIPSNDINIQISDLETAANALTLSALSSNPDIVPVSGVLFGGSGPSRTVKVVPKADANGIVILTIIVSDGIDKTGSSFSVTITPVNDRPVFSPIPDVVIDSSSTNSKVILFNVSDAETPADKLTLQVESSNKQLIPDSAVVIEGTGVARKMTITPVAGIFGESNITLYANDGVLTGSITFKVKVNPMNTPPTISNIADMTIPENTFTGTIRFTINDLETSPELLTVTATSSNQTIVPDSNIQLGGYGSNRAIVVIPAAHQHGAVTITVFVKDNKDQALEQFILTIENVNIFRGDLNDSGVIDLTDAIIGLQILSGIELATVKIYLGADVNNDRIIGVEDVIFILQMISQHRLNASDLRVYSASRFDNF